ncbi:MAG: transketolase C-terminal domain-containing protein [Bacteroidota bacterium]
MIKFDPASIRVWSLLGQGGALGYALLEMVKENGKIMAITGDLARIAGLDRFVKAFPERLINTGIAEQNMLGIAAAFANEEFVPFAISFANFSVLRACEPMRHFMGYMQRNVKLVGLGSGFAMGIFGNTHYCMEDLAIVRAIPGIVILSPADCTELVKATEAASKFNGPVYLRLTGVMNNPVVYREDYNFEIGKAIILMKGADIAIVATGSMVYHSLQAAEILGKQGITATVIDMHTIKPLDTDTIDHETGYARMIVSVEEHAKSGGLGGAIAEHLASVHDHRALLRLGIEDKFKPAGDYRYMLEQHELLPEQIAHNIRQKYLSLK